MLSHLPPRAQLAVVALFVACVSPTFAADGSSPPEQLRFFEQEVRPLLAERCFRCHGPDAPLAKGDLRITSHDSLMAGGSRGPAISLGGRDSLLLEAVRYQTPGLRMPPDGALPIESVRVLERWVEMGAPWPEKHVSAITRTTEDPIEAGREWWSFRAVSDPAPPPVADPKATSPIDQFVFARLKAAGLEPSQPATDREQARRAYLDLIGLPPTKEELDAYESDPRPNKWEQLIDRLLASRRYGERWGRRWLDVVRYSQTNGYELDDEKPYAWRFRDYVIAAFNDDKPYDRFLTEQLAGDVIDNPTRDSMIATGFYRLGPWDAEPDDEVEAAFTQYDDILRTVGEGMMGVTLGCARCHDHKYDPIKQDDYYRMLAFIRNIEPYEIPQHGLRSTTLAPLDLTPKKANEWRQQKQAALKKLTNKERALLRAAEKRLMNGGRSLPTRVKKILGIRPRERTKPQQTAADAIVEDSLKRDQTRDLFQLREEKKLTARSFPGELDWTLSVGEYKDPQPTHVLGRGRADSPGKEVGPGYVEVLCSDDGKATPRLVEDGKLRDRSGTRRALAEWVTNREHPTTWRVIVNRIWQGHFGRGLVVTPNDFGAAGVPPTHPELLDWLACRLADDGYRLKALHRRIMTSYTYRMASRQDDPAATEKDPDNRLLWRQNLRRLDAETIRDSVLKVSGHLNVDSVGGESFFPQLSREALAGMSRPGEGWGVSTASERGRRSIYSYSKRGMRVPFLEIFDQANPDNPVGRRATTTTASQALAFANGAFLNEEASILAESIRNIDARSWAKEAFQRVLARAPSTAELETCNAYLRSQESAFSATEPSLTFRSAMPDRVEEMFLSMLPGTALLDGPRSGWTYARGDANTPYNATLRVDPQRGAAAFRNDIITSDAKLTAQVKMSGGCQVAAFVFRAELTRPLYSGVQVVLDLAEQEVRVEESGPEENTTVVVKSRKISMEKDRWFTVEVNANGSSIALCLDDKEVLATKVSRKKIGYFGFRARGNEVALRDLRVETPQKAYDIRPDDPGRPIEQALEALCLLLLNVNEFVYVD